MLRSSRGHVFHRPESAAAAQNSDSPLGAAFPSSDLDKLRHNVERIGLDRFTYIDQLDHVQSAFTRLVVRDERLRALQEPRHILLREASGHSTRLEQLL